MAVTKKSWWYGWIENEPESPAQPSDLLSHRDSGVWRGLKTLCSSSSTIAAAPSLAQPLSLAQRLTFERLLSGGVGVGGGGPRLCGRQAAW